MRYSLQRLLVILGLVFIPFYEIILKALPYVRSVAPDTRAPKEIIALVFALSIGLLAVFQGTIKPFKNKLFLIIPVYLLFNLIMSPHADMFVNNIESGDFYFWKPFSEVLCFTLMIIAIASMDIDFDYILNVMVICGSIMAGYVILQRLGLDQFWIVKTPEKWTALISNAQIGGNLGQKTIVSSFIVMIIPLAIYLRRFWLVGLMSLACLLTNGMMVTLTLMLIMMIYLFKFNRKFIIPIISIIIVGACFIVTHKQYAISKMDGRYDVWKDTLSDIKNGPIEGGHTFAISGIGLGRFGYLFPSKHKSEFQQTHNDLLEFVYDCGLVGGFLLIGGIYFMFQGVLTSISPINFSILLSLMTILFYSLGSFPFQLGAHQFYSAVLVGLLHNEKLIRRV